MKKFISKVGLFFLLIAIVDIVFGYTMGAITKRIDIGGAGRNNYICDKMTDDVLIFGSSRAEHHYNAQMISDSLGVSCYNAGEGGCGIILAYGRLLMILERCTPKGGRARPPSKGRSAAATGDWLHVGAHQGQGSPARRGQYL